MSAMLGRRQERRRGVGCRKADEELADIERQIADKQDQARRLIGTQVIASRSVGSQTWSLMVGGL